MSLLNPGFDSKHLVQSAVNSKSLSTLVSESQRAETMNMSPENYAQWLRRREEKFKTPAQWSAIDTELTKIGSLVNYPEDGKKISSYNSSFAQTKINTKQIKAPNEKTLLSGVTEIAQNADFKSTSLESLGTIKKVGGSIYLDTSSALKDISSLKEVKGKVVVFGKSKAEIENFLKNANFSFETLGKKISTVLRCY